MKAYNKQIIWKCRAKATSQATCNSVNYYDEEIRTVFCKVMDIDKFDEELFSETTEKIIIRKDGTVDFCMKDGTVRTYETLKLCINQHESTSTDEFTDKIQCTCCGNSYHRYCCYGKYFYWHCSGKKRITAECRNVDFSDCNLRQITAYIMGTDKFDGSAFLKEISYISVNSDGSLEYHFIDGRIKKWQKT